MDFLSQISLFYKNHVWKTWQIWQVHRINFWYIYLHLVDFFAVNFQWRESYGNTPSHCHRVASWTRCPMVTFPTDAGGAFDGSEIRLHPGRLTWNLKITQLKRKIIFQTIIFRFHVNLPGCNQLRLVVEIPLFTRFCVHIPGGCLGFQTHQQYQQKKTLQPAERPSSATESS